MLPLFPLHQIIIIILHYLNYFKMTFYLHHHLIHFTIHHKIILYLFNLFNLWQVELLIKQKIMYKDT